MEDATAAAGRGPLDRQQAYVAAEDFGQKVDLTTRIAEVLANYPEGTTILKELVQNADDAGATKVCFCLDRRKHGVDSLLYPGLADWQGPALLAYNDSQFTEEDFDSISRIGDSNKQHQAWKTGRFGVGFNSVYHLSDLPSFVSGRYIVFFDPHCKYLPRISSMNPGKRIDFVNSAALKHYRDQFTPYCAFDCNMQSIYTGTLFRFPLRTAQQAGVSRLSKQFYSEEDIMSLLYELHSEAVLTMLFLKNVRVLEIYEWQGGLNIPRRLCSSYLKSPTNEVCWHRQSFSRFSRTWPFLEGNMPFLVKQIDSFILNFVSEVFVGASELENKSESFLIVQCMEASTSRIGLMATNAEKVYNLQLLPWASVAANISHFTHKGNHEIHTKEGQAFCFLPLPVKTRLPVHINGYFELSSNRRDIWYGTDMDRMGKLRSDWNTLLLEDVIAPAYCHLLSVVHQYIGTKQSYYALWPSGTFVQPWQTMVSQFYRNIVGYSVLYSDMEGGKFIMPSKAVLHDEEFWESDKLACALVAEGLPIVRMPKPLVNMLFTSFPSLKVVFPKFIRLHFMKPGKHVALTERAWGLTLLEYCLSDVIDEEAAEMLFGLPLIPLANGEFGVFGRMDSQPLYFFCQDLEWQLLDGVKDRVIDRNISKELSDRIFQIVQVSSTNICPLTDIEFEKLFMRILPAEWKFKEEVEWRPALLNSHPKEEWIILLWQYLGDTCDELSIFEEWPILPTTNGLLCKAKMNSGIVSGVFTGSLERILIELGCRILISGFEARHPVVSKYVHDSSGTGILHAVLAVCLSSGSTYEEMFMNVNDLQRRELRSFFLDTKWHTKNQMMNTDLDILRSLPIFEIYFRSDSKETRFVALNCMERFLPPANVDATLLGPEFLYSTCWREEEILIKVLGVQRMGRSLFYKCKVINQINKIPSNVRNQTMLTILRELPQLCLQDSSFMDVLKHTAFVPTAREKLRCPHLLYDPRVMEIHAILFDQESFPSEDFRDDNILDMLKLLGLQITVSTDAILESAHQVESLMNCDPEKAYVHSRVLLTYLELNSNKFISQLFDNGNNMLTKVTNLFQNRVSDMESFDKFWNELSMVCWCPVLVHCPHPGLPWPSVSNSIAPPKLVRLPSDMWLTSASMRILDGECHSTVLSQKLGWLTPPSGKVVAAQLLELGKNHVVVDDKGLRQILATVIPRIYSVLTERLGTDEMDIIKAILEGSQWIWVGDGFTNVQEVVLSGPLHLAPYLRVIPADLTGFKELFIELGVQNSLTPSEYALILSKMAIVKGGLPVDSQELGAATWIIQHLAALHFRGEAMGLFLLDVNAILVPSSELVYNDAPWLLTTEGVIKLQMGRKSVPKFVHANISNDVAERLGVRSLRRLLLSESADSMDVTLYDCAEAFGQHEALTTRLKHILEMYADGSGILCELVQNADDAGASEVIFLMDKSQYGSSSVLSPQMSEWQGPALYCFNNSVFTERDLYAISRIGQDSKLEKPFTVGRFGLGFNCVYHFTDVPGFVSGENLIIFDPHARNLPGVSPSHPGLKINFPGKGILEQFPDQCCPYLLFGCDMKNSFNGTLFRFPLRNAATAAYSQIKKEPYTPEMVFDIFSAFQSIASEALIFLHNITSITVYMREGLDQEMQLLYKVQKHPMEVRNKQDGSERAVYEFVHGSPPILADKEYFYTKLQLTPEDQLPWYCGKVRITMSGVEFEKTWLWIVCGLLGGGRARALAVTRENQAHRFVPWGGIAVRLQQDANITSVSVAGNSQDAFVKDSSVLEGHAFCFLPLPIKIQFPVHINGYFELSSNRRDIWHGIDMVGGGKLRSDWNCYLLEDVISPAYARLLEKAVHEFGSFEDYYSLWPRGSMLRPWSYLLKGVYIAATNLELLVLYTAARGGRWISAKEAVFPDYSFPDASDLIKMLADAGLALVNAPEGVVAKFREFCPSLRYLSPQLLRSSLIKRKRAFKLRSVSLLTLKYCLFDIQWDESVDRLHGLPLVPLATGLFASFADSRTEEKVYVASENDYHLLKDLLPEMLVDCSIEAEIFQKIWNIALTGRTSLIILTSEHLKDLLPRILPTDWRGKRIVAWTPGLGGHPTQAWMVLLWKFLNLNSSDLSLFSEWPLLPTSDGHLLQLRKDSCVIKDGGWNENMVTVLQKAHCFVIKTDIPVFHPNLGEYIQDITATGVLNAFLAAVDGHLYGLAELLKAASEIEVRELRSFFLQMKWFSTGQMCPSQLQVLKALPLYRSYGDQQFVNLLDCTRWLAPDDVDTEVLDENFICAESQKEENILIHIMGVAKLSKKDFYEQFVFKKVNEVPGKVMGRIMLTMLHDFPSLMKESPTIATTLSHLAFVPTAKGNLELPGRLYDPRVLELHSLLDKQTFFPAMEFTEDSTLDVLIQLGLRRSLGCRGLLDSAYSVGMLNEVNEQEALKLAQALLLHLDSLFLAIEPSNRDSVIEEEVTLVSQTDVEQLFGHDAYTGVHTSGNILSTQRCGHMDRGDATCEEWDEQFWVHLGSISWCPVYVDSPTSELPWPSGLKGLIVPSKFVRPKSQMWLVSATMRILQGECRSTKLMAKLGWLEKPKVGVLAVQLIELSKSYFKMRTRHTSIHAIESNAKMVEEFNIILQREIPRIYSMLEEFLDTENALILQSMLDGTEWVWIGSNFLSSKEVAFDSPVGFEPYLHPVPPEISCFKTLLISLGVRGTFDCMDYVSVLQRIGEDVNGKALSPELLNFVLKVLEAISEFLLMDNSSGKFSLDSVLVPDATGVLGPPKDLVYNDAPWLLQGSPGLVEAQRFVHAGVRNDLAEQLGAKSLRYLSLVDKEMTRDLPCLPASDIAKLLLNFGDKCHLLFDLLELADCCKAQKMHVVYDKREHSQVSILQPNLGKFQGPALTVTLEGVELTVEEVCALQNSPFCKIRRHNLLYGSGLLSCYYISDFPLLISGGCLYLFDPSGLSLAASLTNGKVSSSGSPVGKAFTLQGTDLPERFADQFEPFCMNQDVSWASTNVTIIRIPLRSQTTPVDCEASKIVKHSDEIVDIIFKEFQMHASESLLFLNSVEDVCLSIWEKGEDVAHEHFSVKVDPTCASLRNPFDERKWRRFHFSNIFGSSSNAIKMHCIDVLINDNGNCILDKWLIVLTLGSGQTRNMALDRKYLSYNLNPVAGVAAHVSRNGLVPTSYPECILAPLPVSTRSGLPVVILGNFLVSHRGTRYLFNAENLESSTDVPGTATILHAKSFINSAWNKELMACVCDSYVELLLECQRLTHNSSLSHSDLIKGHGIIGRFKMPIEHVYSLWPRSQNIMSSSVDSLNSENHCGLNHMSVDGHYLIESLVNPMYSRLADLAVWQLHGGTMVKATEGVFLSPPGTEQTSVSPPASVCEFLKEHFRVFSVPWELIRGLEAVQIRIKVITPKMVRTLMRASLTSSMIYSIEMHIDLLEYCCADFQDPDSAQFMDRENCRNIVPLQHASKGSDSLGRGIPLNKRQEGFLARGSIGLSHSGGDALELVSSIGRALLDYGKGVVEDIGRDSGHENLSQNSASVSATDQTAYMMELKGLPCPTATAQIGRLGMTELWVGNQEQQMLLSPLAGKFVNRYCLERPLLLKLFQDKLFQSLLQVHPFSPQLLSNNLRFVLPKHWLARVYHERAVPWVIYEQVPASDWIYTFWKNVNPLSTAELSLFSQWPLIPGFMGSALLIKIQNRDLVFVPPIPEVSTVMADPVLRDASSEGSTIVHTCDDATLASKVVFTEIERKHTWLFPFLSQCSVPIYNRQFVDCSAIKCCLPMEGQTLGQVITSKLLAAHQAGYFFSSSLSLSPVDCEALFSLLSKDFCTSPSLVTSYNDEKLLLLKSLPIYKTTNGHYTSADTQFHCIVPPEAFLQPQNDYCLQYYPPEDGGLFYHAIGIPELTNQEVMIRFGLPGFEGKSQGEQECILSHIYMDWDNLQHEAAVTAALKETKFICSDGDIITGELFQPQELLNPTDALLRRVYAGDDSKFPGRQFTTGRWLQILCKLGLRSAADPNVLLECAEKVEELGKKNALSFNDMDVLESKCWTSDGELSLEIWSLAGAVVDSILGNFASLYGRSFCESLSKIAFVPAERGIPNMGGKYSRKVLASYREVVLMRDWPLAWAFSPILSIGSFVPPEFSWDSLYLRSPPPFPTVFKHLQIIGKNGGGDILARWPASQGMMSVEDAFGNVLKYLSSIWDNLSDSDYRALQNVSFIPVANGTRLTCANTLYVRLGMNLAPFIFELTSSYFPYVKVLADLGMQESPTADSMRNLLLNMREACGYQRLNPNELCAVLRILQFICEEAKRVTPDMSQFHKLSKDAVVPDDTGRLVHAETCVYVDALGIRLVNNIDTSRVRFAHPCLSDELCIQLGIRKLSEVVVEVLNEDVPLQVIDSMGFVSQSAVSNRLQSMSFQEAVFAIVQDCSKHIPSLASWKREGIQMCFQFAADRLQFVQGLYTRFLMLPGNVDVTQKPQADMLKLSKVNPAMKESGHRVYEFVDKLKTKILVAEPPEFISLSDILAVVVSRLLDSPICLPICSLFNVPVGSEAMAMEILQVNCDRAKELRTRNNQNIVPGQEVLASDGFQMSLHPLRPFYAGEIVAWRLNREQGSTHRYGMVVEDARASAGQALYQLQVETSPGEIQSLLSANVLSFKGLTLGSNIGSQRQVNSVLMPQPKNDFMAAAMLPNIPSEAKKQERGFTKKVHAGEVVQAVNDMMAAVGLPTDLEYQSMLHQALTLQDQLTAAHTALLLEQERSDTAVKEAENARTAWLCRICLSSEVDTVLVPCSHVLCQRCCAAVSRCPFCRQPVSKALRMYRP